MLDKETLDKEDLKYFLALCQQNRVVGAIELAKYAHSGQVRKYTNAPYITHPARVAMRVALLDNPGETTICSAWLHDVVEDCEINFYDIQYLFGERIAGLVSELTNTSKILFPDLKRAERKANDRERLRTASHAAKRIKLLDRIDNLNEMDLAPWDLLETYCEESQLLLDKCLRGTDPALEAELQRIITSLLDKVLFAGIQEREK
jgi:(p)ppGpp synthase/HD superfamily hydrolase